MASPPKPNHLIEINCKESNAATFESGDNSANGHGILSNSKNRDNSDSVQNVDIFKKLKQIHDKIKRLNKTFTDPKVNKLHEKTLKFLAKNNKKFLNMTNEIGILGKKLSETKKLDPSLQLTTPAGHKAKPTVSTLQDLENEIENFFASKDLIGKQVDELDRINKPIKMLKSKLNAKKGQEIAEEESSLKEFKVKKKKKKPNKDLKLDLNNQNKLVHEETLINDDYLLDEVDESITEDDVAKKSKAKETENDWLKALEKLDEELDLGEKIISKDDPVAAESIISSHTAVSDSLAELMPGNKNSINQGQAAHLSVVSGSASASNAHLQDLSHSSEAQQSSSTGLLENIDV